MTCHLTDHKAMLVALKQDQKKRVVSSIWSSDMDEEREESYNVRTDVDEYMDGEREDCYDVLIEEDECIA